MDPVTLGIAGAGLLGQQLASHNAQDTAEENLAFQRQNAANQLRLAKAGRTDQFGNKVTFDDALNQWITQLTPQQKALVAAGEREQLQGLNEDAPRNRLIRARAAARGAQASEDYNRSRADLLYGHTPSEGATRADITRLITQARGTGDRALATLVNRNDMRTGGNLPVIKTGSTAPGPGERLAQTLLQARTQALQETGTREAQSNTRNLPRMQAFSSVAQGGQGTPYDVPNTGAGIFGQEGDMAKLVESALASGGKGVGDASENLSKMNLTGMPKLQDAAYLIRALSGQKLGRPSGTLGTTKGAKYNAADDVPTTGWDNVYENSGSPF